MHVQVDGDGNRGSGQEDDAIVSGVEHKKFRLFSLLFFLVMLLSNLSGFLITEGGVFFTIIKLLSTVLFCLFSFVALYKLFKIT
jgi:hypothetical protein